MTPLGARIAALIAAEGPIPVERFMALCLGDPEHGYYMRRDPLGAAGDFTTAPEISQMFGELVGLWAAQVWLAMGSPAPVSLVELGPGRGTLMADALRAMRIVPGLAEALRVHLVETSPVLVERQRQMLAGAGVPVAWHRRWEDVPEGPAIVLANEFFDAMPIRQYVRGPEGWHERLVGLGDGGGLAFGLAPVPETMLTREAPEGSLLELCPVGLAIAVGLAGRIARFGGASLIVDYGHAAPGFGDTLQAVRRHAYADPLAAPGEADLTAHVDFAALAAAARQAGAAVDGPAGQGALLETLGLEARAERLGARAGRAQREVIAAAARRLAGTGPGEMGALFRAMAVRHPALPPTPGPWAG